MSVFCKCIFKKNVEMQKSTVWKNAIEVHIEWVSALCDNALRWPIKNSLSDNFCGSREIQITHVLMWENKSMGHFPDRDYFKPGLGLSLIRKSTVFPNLAHF